MAKQTYSGSAVHPNFGAENVDGIISFDSASLHFSADDGRIEMPLHRLQIDWDKENDRIFFRDIQWPDAHVSTDDFEIFKHRAFVHIPELREQVARLSGEKNAWMKLVLPTGVFFAAFLVVALVGFWAGGFTLRYLVEKVPTTYESDIGDQLVRKLKARDLLVNNTNDIAFLQTMGKRLLPKQAKSKFKFEFCIVPISEPNAFAVPGGKIFVTEGALQLLSREELAGVLAHEITHVVKRHALRQIISSIGTYAALRLLVQGDSAFQSAVGDASEQLFTRGFSQSLENEADDGGWDYLIGANIDPRCLPNALKKLESVRAEEKKTNSSEVFSTHPLTSKRLKRFEKRWAALEKKTGFVDFSKSFPEKPAQ